MTTESFSEKRLLEAARAGDIGGLRAEIALAEAGSEELAKALANAQDLAATKGRLEAVAYLLDIDPDPFPGANLNWICPLASAATHGHADVVDLILERAPYSAAALEQALASAAAKGRLEIVKTLLVRAGKESQEARGKALCRGLSGAITGGQFEIAAYLIAEEAKLETKPKLSRFLKPSAAHAPRRFMHSSVAPLVQAGASQGRVSIVKLLLESVEHSQAVKDQAFLAACDVGDLPTVKLLAQHGADVRTSDSSGPDAPLIRSIQDGDPAVTGFLMNHGADPNARDGEALWQAARNDRFEAARLLLDRGVPADIGDNRALLAAASFASEELVALLIERGANPRANNGQPLRSCMASRGPWLDERPPEWEIRDHGPEMAAALLKNGACLGDLTPREREALFLHALKNGSPASVATLLDAKACPEAGQDALNIAAIRLEAAPAILETLVERGAPSDQAALDATLAAATYNARAEAVAWLLDRGANPNANDGSPLKDAWRLPVATLLLERGAKRDWLDAEHLARLDELLASADDPATLEAAALGGELDTVRFLLERGSDPGANDGAALRQAVDFSRKEIARLLVERGADPETLDEDCRERLGALLAEE